MCGEMLVQIFDGFFIIYFAQPQKLFSVSAIANKINQLFKMNGGVGNKLVG